MRRITGKTLTIVLAFFCCGAGIAQQTDLSVGNLYEQTTSIWRQIENGQMVKALQACRFTIKTYDHEAYAGRYIPYLWNYMGEAFSHVGDIGMSRSCYLIALNQARKAADAKIQNTIRINLAATYHEAHDYRTCLSQSAAIMKDQSDQLSIDQQVLLLNNMAVSHLSMKNLPAADSLFNLLFKKTMQIRGIAEFDTLIAYRNYGNYLMMNDQLHESLKFLVTALTGFQRTKGRDHFQTANTWLYLGRLYEFRNLSDSALFCYDTAIAILEPREAIAELNILARPVNYETIYLEALYLKGLLRSHQAQNLHDPNRKHYLEEAFEIFKTAIDRVNLLIQNLLFTESGFIISDKVRRIFDSGIATAVALSQLTGEIRYLDKAFMWAIESKSISLYIAGMVQLDPLEDNTGIEQQIEYYSVRSSLEQIRHSSDMVKTPVSADSTSALTHKLADLKDSIQAYLSINPALPTEQELLKFYRPANFRTRTYLNFHELDSSYLVFGVNRKERFYKILPRAAGLTDSVARFKQTVSSSQAGYYSEAQITRFCNSSHYIYNSLLRPLASEIRTKKLLINADGTLSGFPFELLLTEVTDSKTGSPGSFKNLPYLFRNKIISYISLPYPNSRRKQRILKSDSVAIIVDQSDASLNAVQNESTQVGKAFSRSRLIDADCIPNKFGSLKTMAVIHFAGHVRIHATDPYQSQINGRLDWGTILASRLNCKLVFINGCESAVGPTNSGEGMLSPGFAFALAGSKSVIESLWIAPDNSVADIAGLFYNRVYHQQPAEALYSAKKEYLEKATEGMAHPHFWAGLICYQNMDYESSNFLMYGIYLILISSFSFVVTWLIRKQSS